MPRRTKRVHIRRAFLCLFFGGVMTVVIAWASALFAPTSWGGSQALNGPYFEDYRPDDWPQLSTLWNSESTAVSDRDASASVKTKLMNASGATDVFEDVTYEIWERRTGFPWRSMSFIRGGVWGSAKAMADPNFPQHSPPSFPALARGVDLPNWIPRSIVWRTLPLRPIWPGFLFSTLSLSLLAWPLLGTPSFWRARRHRRRREGGQCPKCAYPTADLAICPECGRAAEAGPYVAPPPGPILKAIRFIVHPPGPIRKAIRFIVHVLLGTGWIILTLIVYWILWTMASKVIGQFSQDLSGRPSVLGVPVMVLWRLSVSIVFVWSVVFAVRSRFPGMKRGGRS